MVIWTNKVVQIDSSTFWADNCVIFSFGKLSDSSPGVPRHRPEDFWVTLSAFKMTKGSKPHQGIEANGLVKRTVRRFAVEHRPFGKGDEPNFGLPSFSGAFQGGFCHLPDPSEPVKSSLHSCFRRSLGASITWKRGGSQKKHHCILSKWNNISPT